MKRPDHNNGSYVPFSLREVGGFSYVPFSNQYTEDAGDGACGLLSLFERTRTPNRLQMPWQRQHILLCYLKTLSVCPVEV